MRSAESAFVETVRTKQNFRHTCFMEPFSPFWTPSEVAFKLVWDPVQRSGCASNWCPLPVDILPSRVRICSEVRSMVGNENRLGLFSLVSPSVFLSLQQGGFFQLSRHGFPRLHLGVISRRLPNSCSPSPRRGQMPNCLQRVELSQWGVQINPTVSSGLFPSWPMILSPSL